MTAPLTGAWSPERCADVAAAYTPRGPAVAEHRRIEAWTVVHWDEAAGAVAESAGPMTAWVAMSACGMVGWAGSTPAEAVDAAMQVFILTLREPDALRGMLGTELPTDTPEEWLAEEERALVLVRVQAPASMIEKVTRRLTGEDP